MNETPADWPLGAYFDKPIDDAIMDGLLHLPVRGKELQMAAYQVRLNLRNAGYEIRKVTK